MPPRPDQEGERNTELEDKIRKLEKKLEKEHEQVLMANLKSAEEKAVSERVENSIKDIQEKLRRDRRESQAEESRLALEAKIGELENRLIQERETWVSTLKNQMSSRENQDKEIETHFTMRIQEMERRWLEEKAHWQSVTTARAEEIRKLEEKLEGLSSIETECVKAKNANKALEEKVLEFCQSQAELKAKVTAGTERERDFYQMKADLQGTREYLKIAQDKYESVRSAAKEREQRLLSDNERLQNDLANITRRIRAEYESEIRRIRAESDGDLKKARAQSDLSGAALQRMRAVGSALEKQVASLRAQATEAKALKDEMRVINERYKAEFIVLHKKWQDREVVLRSEAEAAYDKKLETEKARIKLRSQEEIQARVVRVQEQLRKEMEGEVLDRERKLRNEMDRRVIERTRKAQAELDDMRNKLEEELRRKSEEYSKKDMHWQERQVRTETELNTLKAALGEIRTRLAAEEEKSLKTAADKNDIEKTLSTLYEKTRMQQEEVDRNKARLEEEEKQSRRLELERETLAQGRKGSEEKFQDARKSIESLEQKIEEAVGKIDLLQNQKVEKEEIIAKIEAEHSRQLETWRRKMDLLRRDFEGRLKSAEAERARVQRDVSSKGGGAGASSGGGSFGERLKGFWGGKSKPSPPPEPPAPPTM